MDLISAFAPVLHFIMNRFGKLEVVGKENLIQGSGAIVVCNHCGWADPMWLSYATDPNPLHFMAKKELFSNAFTSWLMYRSRTFPVDRGKTRPGTVKKAVELLCAGRLVMIYPTGTRSRNENEIKRGAATIAVLAKVPIVPAHYDGPKVPKLSHLLARPDVRVTFGAPIAPAIATDRETIRELSFQIAEELARLGRDNNN